MKKFLIILFFYSICVSEVKYTLLGENPYSLWEADSLFLGADLIVKDSTKSVKVIYIRSVFMGDGRLFFIYPYNPDSAIFLFHSKIKNYPEENDTINLGKYPKGTSLTFMFIVDSVLVGESIIGKKLYSGQNRDGIDQYISEYEDFEDGKKWAVAGRINNETVVMGFNLLGANSFVAVVFKIENVELVK